MFYTIFDNWYPGAVWLLLFVYVAALARWPSWPLLLDSGLVALALAGRVGLVVAAVRIAVRHWPVWCHDVLSLLDALPNALRSSAICITLPCWGSAA